MMMLVDATDGSCASTFLPSSPSDATHRQRLLTTGQWSDVHVVFTAGDGARTVTTRALHRAIVARCDYFWRALQPVYHTGSPTTTSGVILPLMRLELPLAPETEAAPWSADDVQRFLTWVYTDGGTAWQAAWQAAMAECSGGRPLARAAVDAWLRQHALAQYLGFDAYVAGIEQVLAGWHLDALAATLMPPATRARNTDAVNEEVAALLSACAADGEGRRRLLLRVAAWATTVLASLDESDPAGVRKQWLDALDALLDGAGGGRGQALLRENLFLTPERSSVVAIVCDGCFTRPVPDDPVEQVKLDRTGRWRLLRSQRHVVLLTMGGATDACDVEFALLDGGAKGVTTALLHASGHHGYDVPPALHYSAAPYVGRCMHCGSHARVHVAALQPRPGAALLQARMA